MTDMENKDVQLDKSDDIINPESEDKELIEKGECENNEKYIITESNRKDLDSPEEKNTNVETSNEESTKENPSESGSKIEQDVQVKDNTDDDDDTKLTQKTEEETKNTNKSKQDNKSKIEKRNDETPEKQDTPMINKDNTNNEKKIIQQSEVDTKTTNQSKGENESKTEKNTDQTLEKQDTLTTKTDEGVKKPRKLSDANAIKGKLDFLLKKHDDELDRKQSSEQEESSLSEMSDEENKDNTNQKEKEESKEKVNKSDEKSSKKSKKDKKRVDDSKENDSKSIDKSAKKLKADKKTAKESKEKSSKKEGSSALSDHLLNALNSPEKHSGILQKKKSSPFWSWKRYYFVLEGKLLNFYDPQQGNEEQQLNSIKGSIDLTIITSVKSKKPGLLKSNFPFTLARKSQGPIVLATDTSEEREKWIKIIGEELKRTNHHNSEPELRGIGTEEENARKSATLPTQHKTHGSLPTINIQEEDPQKKSEEEEEKPTLIVPKKIRGVGVMNFAAIGAVKLKNISNSKKEEKEEKDPDASSTDTQENNLQTETTGVGVMNFKPQITGVTLKKVSHPTKSQEKKETDADTNASEQNESEGLFGIKLKKTERNLATGNDKTIKRKRSVSPNIPLSKNLQSVVSKNKDDEDLENNIECNEIKQDTSKDDTDNNKKVQHSIGKTDQETKLEKETLTETNICEESKTIIEKDFIKSNEVSNEIRIDSKDDEANESQTKEGDNVQEKNRNWENNKTCLVEVDQDSQNQNQSSSEIAEDDIISAEVLNKSRTKHADDKLQNEECNENSSINLSNENLKNEKSKDDNELEVTEPPLSKKKEMNEPLNKDHDNDTKLDALSFDIDQTDAKESTIKSKELDETENLQKVETESKSSTIERKESLKGKKSATENEKKSGSGKFSFFKRKNSSSFDLQSKTDKQKSLENTGEVTSHDKKRRPSAFSKLLQGISRGSKSNMNEESVVINKSNDNISTGSQKSPVVRSKNKDNISTGSQKSAIDLSMEKDEDEQNKSGKLSPEIPDKSNSSLNNEPIREAQKDVETEVEELLVVRRDFHTPYDESRYSSYSRTSNKSGDNVPPPSIPEKKGVRESSPVHDVPTSNQPISNIKEVMKANNFEDENVNKIDGYLSAEQIESVVHAKVVVKRKLSLVNNSNNLLPAQPNSQSIGESEQERGVSVVSVTSTESGEPLTGKNFLGSNRSSEDSNEKRKSSNNGEKSQRKCPSYISLTSVESDGSAPLPLTRFLGSDRSSSESGGIGTDSESRTSKDLDSPSDCLFTDPDLKAPFLRPNRPSSIVSANRKSLTQPEFTVMEEGPLTPGGTNEVDKLKFELPSKARQTEDSKIDCESEDEHDDYFPVVGGGAVELRKSPNGSDKLLKNKQTGGNVRTSGIVGLKAYLDEIEDGAPVADSKIGINRLGQSIAVEKLKNEIK